MFRVLFRAGMEGASLLLRMKPKSKKRADVLRPTGTELLEIGSSETQTYLGTGMALWRCYGATV